MIITVLYTNLEQCQFEVCIFRIDMYFGMISGVISNLFTRDEQAEIIQELTPIMKRENPKRSLTHENVMEHFLLRTCQNLHVVFCFSPVSSCIDCLSMVLIVS